MRIYPIGYNYYQSDQRIESLMNDPCTLLIDCRITPWSEHKPQYRKESLVQRWGKRYRPAGHLLGNRKHPANKLYPGKIEIEIMNPGVGIPGLIRYLNEGHDLILLCQCLDYEHCHLKEIVRLLQEAMPEVEVELQGPPPPVPIKYKFENGAKVYVKIRGQKVPAIVLESRWSQEGNYDQVRLRVAQQNAITGKWLVSDLSKPIQSYKLTKRATHIPELDDLPIQEAV